MKKTEQVKMTILENYIDWRTSDEDEREDLKENAKLYVDEDWVDEIEQSSFVEKNKYFQESSYEINDEHKLFEELTLVVVDRGEEGTETIGAFDISQKELVSAMIKSLNE